MIGSIGSIGNISELGNLSPIKNISNLQTLNEQQNEVNSTEQASFQSIFGSLIDNVNQTQATTDADTLAIAQGTADDLHSITINSAKTELALLTAIQVRNKVVDAYKELMQISL